MPRKTVPKQCACGCGSTTKGVITFPVTILKPCLPLLKTLEV